jgi:hypothetical protein
MVFMSLILGIVGLLVLISFFILCDTVKKIKKEQIINNKLLTDLNNQMSEQINLMREDRENERLDGKTPSLN